ncbi:MAG: cation-translocating P-type ATPase [Firmicutes bacterium]|nr:cation-translocating P-type ATPase [Candidatus Fermentithermobacillaceae bacterium]
MTVARSKNWYSLTPEEVLTEFDTDLEKGLSHLEAKRRLAEHGPNELRQRKPPTFFQRFIQQLSSVLILLLIASATVSLFLGEIVDGLVILGSVAVIALMGAIQEARTERALEALKRMAPSRAKVIREGKIIEIVARELVPGDVVLVEAGDRVPCDLRLVESHLLRVDESALTGESVPVDKRAGAVLAGEIPVGERVNMLHMGTAVVYGRGKGVAVATGMNTEMGLIAGMLESTAEEKTPLQRKLDKLGKTLSLLAIAASAFIFALGIARKLPWLEMFMTSVSLAVAAIPEGLPAVITVVLALGVQRMVSRNAIVRRLSAVETLGSTTVICTDKTGTLTRNQMTVREIWLPGRSGEGKRGLKAELTGSGFDPSGEILHEGKPVSGWAKDNVVTLLKAAVLNNDASLVVVEGGELQSTGDPTEISMLVAALKAGIDPDSVRREWPRVDEIPFDSERKVMTTVHRSRCPGGSEFLGGTGTIVISKGAPESILRLCDMDDEARAQVLDEARQMAERALRVLAVAVRTFDEPAEGAKMPKQAWTESGLTFLGLLGMVDPPRPESLPAVQTCKRAGITPVMITGDSKETALAIARDVGIAGPGDEAVSGAEIDARDDRALDEVTQRCRVYARVSPRHKARIVESLKRHGHVVAMTGDGVNDAPALKKADIGVAMGITGTDVAKEASDIVLTDDNFATIVRAVEEGRTIYDNIVKFVFYLVSCNIGEVLAVASSMFLGLPSPLTPVQILWLNQISDTFPAIALGLEKGDPAIMERPPRDPNEPVITPSMAVSIALQSAGIALVTLLAFFLGFGHGLDVGRTMAFSCIVLAEVWRAQTSRSMSRPLYEIGFFTNRSAFFASMASVALLVAVIHVPPLRAIFGTALLTSEMWLQVIGLSLLPAFLSEAEKILKSGLSKTSERSR